MMARMLSIWARNWSKAEIAWRLGKRYIQDEPLDWGCAVERVVEDMTCLRERGHTLRAADRREKATTMFDARMI